MKHHTVITVAVCISAVVVAVPGDMSRRGEVDSGLCSRRNPREALGVIASLASNAPAAWPQLARCADHLRRLARDADAWHSKNFTDADAARWIASFDEATRAALLAGTTACPFDKIIFMKRQRCISSHYYTEHIDGSFIPGGTICILDLKTGKVTKAVTGLTNGVFGRFDLSFDAKKVVFAGKRACGMEAVARRVEGDR